MNALSWLIYLAGVASEISAIAVTVAFFATVSFVVGGIIFLFNADYDDDYEGRRRKVGKTLRQRGIVVFMVASLVLIALPGRDTVYAIAASEMGEEVLNSETGSKAVKALDAWLDRQITPEPEPET